MNERQRRFAEYYAACGNAAEAARQAGYSERTARSQGQRLLTYADIQNYVRELHDQSAIERVASLIQVKAYWSDVMRDPGERTIDRLRAGELLAKTAGAFVHRTAECNEEIVGEYDGEDVIIYMPQILTEEDCKMEENDGEN